MYFQVGPRGSGKTHSLIESMLMRRKPWVVLVGHLGQSYHILSIVEKLGGDPKSVKVATVDHFDRALAGTRASVAVDHAAIELVANRAVEQFLSEIRTHSSSLLVCGSELTQDDIAGKALEFLSKTKAGEQR